MYKRLPWAALRLRVVFLWRWGVVGFDGFRWVSMGRVGISASLWVGV